MGNDLGESKLESSKGTSRVVDTGVKIETAYRTVCRASLIWRYMRGRRRRLLETHQASCSFSSNNVTDRIATAASTSSSSAVTKGTNDRSKGSFGVMHSCTGVATTERALEAEVAVLADQNVKGY
jgi:hypothetical protein